MSHSIARLDPMVAVDNLDGERTKALEICRNLLRGRSSAVWIYGSFWTDHFGPDSDIDLAIAGLVGDRSELAAELSSALGREIDMIEIDHCDPIIGFQVLAHGVAILDDYRQVARIEGDVLSMYFDWKVARQPIEAALANRVIQTTASPRS